MTDPKPVEESEHKPFVPSILHKLVSDVMGGGSVRLPLDWAEMEIKRLLAQEYERGRTDGLNAALAALPKAYQFKGSNAWKPEVGHGYGYGVAEALEQARSSIEALSK